MNCVCGSELGEASPNDLERFDRVLKLLRVARRSREDGEHRGLVHYESDLRIASFSLGAPTVRCDIFDLTL